MGWFSGSDDGDRAAALALGHVHAVAYGMPLDTLATEWSPDEALQAMADNWEVGSAADFHETVNRLMAADDDVAWNLGRVAHLTKLGLAGGYVDEAGTWRILDEALGAARATYRSLPEYGQALVEGRQRWMSDGGADDLADRPLGGDEFDRALAWLVQDPRSPWRSITW